MRRPFAFAAALALVCAAAPAQIGSFDAPAKPKQYIDFATEPQTVPAGKRHVLELRFTVGEGFHVNSHTPKSELLIPTTLTITSANGVVADQPAYPAGKPYSFSFDPTDKLDVYSGAFTIKLPVTAQPGDRPLTASLRYQACDNAACYPPRTLAISVPITAK